MSKILVAGKHLNLAGKGTRSEVLLGEGQHRVVLRVATLDRTQSPGGEVHIP